MSWFDSFSYATWYHLSEPQFYHLINENDTDTRPQVSAPLQLHEFKLS